MLSALVAKGSLRQDLLTVRLESETQRISGDEMRCIVSCTRMLDTHFGVAHPGQLAVNRATLSFVTKQHKYHARWGATVRFGYTYSN